MHIFPPASAPINFRQCFPEGEHRVVAVQIEVGDGIRFAHGPMMRVVEKKRESAATRFEPAKTTHQPRLVPLMHNDDIRIRDTGLEIETGAVGNRLQLGVGSSEGGKRTRAMVRQKINHAPAIAGLKHHNVMAEFFQLPEYAAKKVGISIVPARGEGVREIDKPHARTSCPACWRRFESRPP